MQWRYYFKIIKYGDEYSIQRTRYPNMTFFPSFKTKKEAENHVKNFVSEEFYPLHRVVSNWIVVKLFAVIFLILWIYLMWIGMRFVLGGLSEFKLPEYVIYVLAIIIGVLGFFGSILLLEKSKTMRKLIEFIENIFLR